MNRTLLVTTLLGALLAGCGSPEQGVDEQTTAPTVPSPQAAPLAIGGEIPLQQVATPLLEPGASGWAEVSAHTVELTLAPPVHPSINLRHDASAPSVPVTVQAATDGAQLYLRLRWPDASENTASTRTLFSDGAAVQFALEAGEQSSFMMGAPNGAVNLWYWRADVAEPQNLAAGGFGSTTSLPQGELQSRALYLDTGEWVVVFTRPLRSEGDYQADLQTLPVHLGLATWQGEEGQRDGLKHVTMGWLKLVGAS